jgi:hypothetical protein
MPVRVSKPFFQLFLIHILLFTHCVHYSLLTSDTCLQAFWILLRYWANQFYYYLKFRNYFTISFPCRLSIWGSECRKFLPLLLFCLLSPHIIHAFATFIIVFVTPYSCSSHNYYCSHSCSCHFYYSNSPLRNQVRSHLWYHFFKTTYITSVCILYSQHCNINTMFILT